MGKSPKGKNHPSQLHKLYSNGKTKSEFCPKCDATFMATHKDRKTCGKCGYTVFIKK
ncbi:30S ribosomal protein S27ae [Candidatus Woesearchaeota archaeon]|nr:30S ribosomal protein S27ae [Candidatus Woesearchaeota archaeon]